MSYVLFFYIILFWWGRCYLQTLKHTNMSCNCALYTPFKCCIFLFAPTGLDKIYELTNTPTQYELRFDLGLGSERTYAVYDNFKIAPIRQKFKLTIGKYRGTAGGSQHIEDQDCEKWKHCFHEL